MFATSQGLWKMRIWNLLHGNVPCDLPFPRLHVWMKLSWSPPWCKWRDLEDSSNIKNKEQRNELTGQILRSLLYCWQYLVNTFSHNDILKNKLTFLVSLKHLPSFYSQLLYPHINLAKPYQKKKDLYYWTCPTGAHKSNEWTNHAPHFSCTFKDLWMS